MAFEWRLSLDVPYAFATEPGVQITRHPADFRPQSDSFTNTYREPVTGAVILRPSFLSQSWFQDTWAISNFRYTNQPGYIQAIQRAIDNVAFFTTGTPAGQSPTGVSIDAQPYLPIINESAKDTLNWIVETNFTIAADASFVWYMQAINDELGRDENWFAVQWDNVLLHFNGQGHVRVYQYADRTNLAAPPTLVDQFDIASPSELYNKLNFFWFLPMPGLGLLVQHGLMSQSLLTIASSANVSSVRGHLIPGTGTAMPNGVGRLFEASQVRLAVNPYGAHTMGMQSVSFPSSGTYADAAIDPGYQPSTSPVAVQALFLETQEQGVTAQLKKTDLSGAWSAATDRQGRVVCTLATDNPAYTPFLFGYGVAWNPIFTTRDTTPVTLSSVSGPNIVDKLERFEYTVNEKGVFEGTASLILGSDAAIAIADRGDSTFLLEVSSDNGSTWSTINGGFAKRFISRPVVSQDVWCYRTTCTLYDLRVRFRETHQLAYGALDGLTIAQANDNLLQVNGFAPIGAANYPNQANNTTFPRPPDGQNWRFMPREGDQNDEMIDILMFFLRSQGQEYIEYYDWTNQTWRVTAKPHDSSSGATWILSPYAGDANAGSKIWYYGIDADFEPEPPEANVILAEGLAGTGPHAQRFPVDPIVNNDSISNTSSPDYLGRVLIAKYVISGLQDSGRLAKAGLAIRDAVSHRRQRARQVPIPSIQLNLVPNTHVLLKDIFGNTKIDGWIKRSTVIVEGPYLQHMSLELDSVWEGDIPR